MVEICCVLLGAFLTIVTDLIFQFVNHLKKRKHSTRLLYYDILSITKYMVLYKMDERKTIPNIRYNADWQTILLELDFLTPEQVVAIYNFYDAVFNFNCAFGGNEEARYYEELKGAVTNKEMSELSKMLRHKLKIQSQEK